MRISFKGVDVGKVDFATGKVWLYAEGSASTKIGNTFRQEDKAGDSRECGGPPTKESTDRVEVRQLRGGTLYC